MEEQAKPTLSINRRQFLRTALLTGSVAMVAAAVPGAAFASTRQVAAAQVAGLKTVPRNQTLVTVRGGTQGKFTEDQLWNPFIATANHQTRPAVRVRAAGLLQRLPGQDDHVAGRVVSVLARLHAR